MATAQTLITGAYTQLGVLAAGVAPSTDLSNAGLLLLNQIVGSLNVQRPTIYHLVDTTKVLTALTAKYTVKSSGDFNVNTPNRLEEVTINVGGYDIPVKIVGAEDYARLSFKTQTGQPLAVWYEQDWSTGAATNQVVFAPIPDSAYSATIWSWGYLGTFAALSTAFAGPDGFELFVMMMLAKHLAPTVPVGWTDTLESLYMAAREAYMNHQDIDFTQTMPRVPMASAGRNYNIATDGMPF